MDERLLRKVQSARSENRQGLAKGIGDAIVELSGGKALTVREAKDTLSKLLERVRSGAPQVIGMSKDQAVLISLKDLAEIIAASERKETLAEALDTVGFKPYRREPITVGQGRKSEKITVGSAVPSHRMAR
jgi:antitoxin (DNA-binding transcriptional repressor) of toxin-antitoxin stability system